MWTSFSDDLVSYPDHHAFWSERHLAANYCILVTWQSLTIVSFQNHAWVRGRKTMAACTTNVLTAGCRTLGYDKLTDEQEMAVKCIMKKQNVFISLPTGIVLRNFTPCAQFLKTTTTIVCSHLLQPHKVLIIVWNASSSLWMQGSFCCACILGVVLIVASSGVVFGLWCHQ